MANVDYKSEVGATVQKLSQKSFAILEAEVIKKRVAWFKKNFVGWVSGYLPTPREAFEMVFFQYMNLSEKDIPVVSEMTTEIVWWSTNPCPTLDACQQLGLDTRVVCRSIYEKSTQALISQIDPQLRFSRSYTEIRPHAPHCLEKIVRVDFDKMMGFAIEEAEMAKFEGNPPFGALIAMDNLVIVKTHDTTLTSKDPSQHAELKAIQQASQFLGDASLCGAVLYTTCEPCAMCASLAALVNLTSIVYGVSQEWLARSGREGIRLKAQEIVDKSPAMIEMIGDVRAEDCRALLI